jgi:hypothetical protein
MIRLIPDCFSCTHHAFDRAPVIVTLPIGIGDVVPVTSPPGLRGINARTDSNAICRRDNQTIGAAKAAI